jgi:hypothetical protein
VPIEEIARLADRTRTRTRTRTTEIVYRRELRLVLTTGAEIMDTIFQPPHTEAGRNRQRSPSTAAWPQDDSKYPSIPVHRALGSVALSALSHLR